MRGIILVASMAACTSSTLDDKAPIDSGQPTVQHSGDTSGGPPDGAVPWDGSDTGLRECGNYADPCEWWSVSIGLRATCAVDEVGHLKCWGDDSYGVVSQSPEARVLDVSVGDSHACALATDYTTLCWGDDLYGQSTPPGRAFLAIEVGGDTSCGLDASGWRCWGRQPTEGDGSVAQIAVSRTHGCVVDAAGNPNCWGEDYWGQHPDAGTFPTIAAGDSNTCGIGWDERLTCWGKHLENSAPVEAQGHTAIGVGDSHYCAIRDGSIECRGNNDLGQVDPPEGQFISLSVYGDHACALTKDRGIECWGYNGSGELDIPEFYYGE